MSSGARVKSAYAKQTDKTIPQTGWKTLPNITNGLTVSTELTNSEMLSGGRIGKAGMVTSATVQGDIETELMFEAYDELIAGAFWNDWSGGRASPKTLSIGTTKHQFAISKDFTDINVNHAFLGCVVSSFGLTVDTSSLIKVKFGMTGIGYQESKTESFAKTPTPTPDTAKASGLSIGEIKVDGTKLDVCVESFSLDIDNQTEVQKCLGENIYGGNVLAMIANISGSMTIAYSQKAHDIITNQLTGKTLSLEIPIKFADDKRYVIKIPKFQVSGEIPSPSGKDLVTVDVNYTVVDESPIIERHTTA
ncbi:MULTISPECIES: phage tail tube protein [unclassified Moraxella]|uniref:phage tail tube protein n=1 Tax=unclassified Moraxella TaxID=2685852 RepID=UPI002B404ED9|nr:MULTISPECIES: phage tail tube protein [unclassified Moraxella]